jgi:RNA ligase (TIGR02306 family)
MPLASIQKVVAVEKHPNADLLDITQVLNYKCITKRNQFKVGDLVVFIEPDSVLPDKPWATFYNSKSNRVKAIRLRGEWSFGIIESFENVGLTPQQTLSVGHFKVEEGDDVTELLGVIKYEAPQPQDLSASGVYGFGIPKTDETRWQGMRDIPYGEVCDVTLKIDGQSWSALCKLGFDESKMPIIEAAAIGGRSFLFKENVENNYKTNEKNYGVLKKLSEYCMTNNISLCIRGEQYGLGIQKYAHNPHAKLPLNLAFFSTWLIDSRQYATKGHPLYIFDLAPKLGLPTVPILEKDVVLTPELIKKYDEELETINGVPFEGVVINWKGGSFKVINKKYDSKK